MSSVLFSPVTPVQISLPRKGTETHTGDVRLGRISWFKSHYPARGRKQDYTSKEGQSYTVQISLPRKGTETFPVLPMNDDPHGSNLITPQGDGNVKKSDN